MSSSIVKLVYYITICRIVTELHREDVRLCSDRSGSVCLCQHAPLTEPNHKLLEHVISAIPPPTSLWRISVFLQERGDDLWYKQMAHSYTFLFIFWQTFLKVRLVRGLICSLHFQIYPDPRKDECLSNIREFVKGCALYQIEVSVLRFCFSRSFHLHAHLYFCYWFSDLFMWFGANQVARLSLSWSWEQTNPVCFGFRVITTWVTMAFSVIAVFVTYLLPWQSLKWFMQQCINVLNAELKQCLIYRCPGSLLYLLFTIKLLKIDWLIKNNNNIKIKNL